MKKLKRLKKPKLAGAAQRSFDNASRLVKKQTISEDEKISDALSNVPRITNETVGEHREEVLSSARKFIYPLQQSKHRVVRISVGIFALVIVGFFLICGLSLYKFQSTSGFIYDVTRIVPFPVGKAGSKWVGYESYLFELRRNMHYYQTQQGANFDSKDGKSQLQRLKSQAMDQVIQDAYIKQLAAEHAVTVSNKAVDGQLALVRSQNRLGSNSRVFKEVLNEFWGWSEADFKRELKQQMLKQAVVAKLDTKTDKRAQDALKQLKSGTDFATLAGQISDDPSTKGNGGQYPVPLTINSREIPPVLTETLFKLKAGQVSDVVDTGYTLEIAKVLDASAGSIHASHIQFNLESSQTFTKPLQREHPSRQYIKF